MNRRDILKTASLLMGGALSGYAITGFLSGCQQASKSEGATSAATTAAEIWQPSFFTQNQLEVVAQIAERIIPKTDTPGAKDALVHQFVDSMLSECYPEKVQTAFLTGFKALATASETIHKKAFLDLSETEQDALLTPLDQAAYDARQKGNSDPSFWSMMKELTLLGFCSSEAGATQVLQYSAVPGQYNGCADIAEVGRTWAT